MQNKFFISLLLFAMIAVTSGCEEKAQQPLQGPSDAKYLSISRQLTRLNTQATEIVRKALVDGSPQVRTNAIEVVSKGRRVDLMPNVVALVNDDFVPVRFALALAVGNLKYYEGKKVIQKLLGDKDQNVRIAAAYAMVNLREGKYIQYLRKAIKSDDQTVRANAALLLGLLGDKSALPDLYRALRAPDSDDKVRFQAVESIARLGDDKIYPKLWAMLISTYADDRIMGIKAMGALRTPQARNALITMLEDDLVEVRLAAAGQLGMLGSKEGEPEVLDFLRNPPAGEDTLANERRNVMAALAIGRTGTPSLINFLPKLLKNESKAVQLAAAQAVFILQ